MSELARGSRRLRFAGLAFGSRRRRFAWLAFGSVATLPFGAVAALPYSNCDEWIVLRFAVPPRHLVETHFRGRAGSYGWWAYELGCSPQTYMPGLRGRIGGKARLPADLRGDNGAGTQIRKAAWLCGLSPPTCAPKPAPQPRKSQKASPIKPFTPLESAPNPHHPPPNPLESSPGLYHRPLNHQKTNQFRRNAQLVPAAPRTHPSQMP